MIRLMVLFRGVLLEFLFQEVSGAHRAAAFHMARGAERVFVNMEC